MEKIAAPEVLVPLGLAAVNLGVDLLYNEADKHRSVQQHEKELACAKQMHKEDLDLAHKLHKEDMEKSRRMHDADMEVAKRDMFLNKQTHLMSTFNELEMHFAQLDADVVNATKESERDMYDQRNQQMQTLIVSSSVMVTALTTLLIQGILPDTTDPYNKIVYGITCGLSYSFLFSSVVLCIETLRLASGFMVRRAKATGDELKAKNEMLQNIMMSLRTKDDTSPPLGLKSSSSALNLAATAVPAATVAATRLNPAGAVAAGADDETKEGDAETGAGAGFGAERKSRLQGTAALSPKSASGFNAIAAGSVRDNELVDNIFANIERKIHNLMAKRVHINQAFFVGRTVSGTSHMSFERFWEQYCETMYDWAVKTFYLGTALMLFSTILWMWPFFFINYNSFWGGVFGIVPIIFSVPMGIYVYLYARRRLVQFEIEADKASQLSMAKDLFSDPISNPEDDKIFTIANLRGGYTTTPTSYSAFLGSGSADSRDLELGGRLRSFSRDR